MVQLTKAAQKSSIDYAFQELVSAALPYFLFILHTFCIFSFLHIINTHLLLKGRLFVKHFELKYIAECLRILSNRADDQFTIFYL